MLLPSKAIGESFFSKEIINELTGRYSIGNLQWGGTLGSFLGDIIMSNM